MKMAESWGLLLVVVLVLVVVGAMAGESTVGIGVNWGTVSMHRLSPYTVVDLMKENKIGKVKLFDADPGSLKALMGSGIEVMVGIPNEMLSLLSSSSSASDLWINRNLSAFLVKGGANIKYDSSPHLYIYI